MSQPRRRSGHALFAIACGGSILFTGCGSRSDGTGAPQIQAIPLQTTGGQGSAASVDLASFVTDRENHALTFAVMSGGGSFTGSTYVNMFDTLGTYDVMFEVTDANNETSNGTFQVKVNQANFAVVRADGDALQLLDTDTEKFVEVSASSDTETFVAGLPKGELIFERQRGSSVDLLAYNPATRTTSELGVDPALDERYVAMTMDNRVLFTRGDSNDTDLFAWNAATGLIKTVSLTEGEHDRNAIVGTTGLVYFERGASGQADIYVYDPSEDSSQAVSTDANAEAVLAKTPGGGVVLSRIGGAAETDLFWFEPGTGLVEVGGDQAATIDLQSKTFHAVTSTGEVVFSAAASATSKTLFIWSPSGGLSRAVVAGVDLTFRAISGDDVILFTQQVASQDDIFLFDAPGGTPGSPVTVSADAANETVEGLVVDGGSTFVVYTRAGTPNSVHVYAVTGATTDDLANAAGVEFSAVLNGGDIAYRLADGSAVFHYDPATKASTNASAGITGGSNFDVAGKGTEDGDFIITATVAAQTDLFLWDQSAGARVVVSSEAGNDVFAATSSAGEVLFTRVTAGNSNADLFLFDPIDATAERLTEVNAAGQRQDFEVVGSYSADNS